MSSVPVDSTLFSGMFNFEFLPFAITSDVGPQFVQVAAINSTQVWVAPAGARAGIRKTSYDPLKIIISVFKIIVRSLVNIPPAS
jgi:hypothetical protein